MIRSNTLVSTLFVILMAVLSCGLVVQTIGRDAPFSHSEPQTISRAAVAVQGGVASTQNLPESVNDLPAHSQATVAFSANVKPGDVLFLHTVYTGYRVYADGTLIGEFGAEGSYPPFLSDPPSNAVYLDLPGISGSTDFRIEFTTPASRDSLYLYPVLLGSQSSILETLANQYGPSFLLSVAFLLLGCGLLVFSIPFFSYETRGKRFRYPGLIALFSGIWQFSENPLTVYLLQNPSLLYLCAFAGMFLLTLPLVKLTILVVGHSSSILLRFLQGLLEASVLIAFALQLAGVVQFSQSSRYFTVLLPITIWTLTFYCFYQGIAENDKYTIRYGFAVSMLALGSALEALNYYFRVVGLISEIFQIFMLAFVVIASVLAMSFAKRVYAESLQKLEFERDVQLLERSIDAQREHNEMMLQHEREVRRLRHDMRHHYTAIRDMVKAKQYDELSQYVSTLDTTAIEAPSEAYCENPIANSMCAHYKALADERGYDFDTKLDIPANMPHLSDGDLCVIIGNLLENALEACDKVKTGTPKIIFRSHRQGPLLFMTLDNSLGEQPGRKSGGGFATSKKESGHGIGLRSILAVAEKYNGEAAFEVSDGMFRSNLYLEI